MAKVTLALWNRIGRFIKQEKLIKPDDRVLLAVSGGPDSMMMLHFFHKTHLCYFAVFHLNHMIRKESYKDEELVQRYCRENSIDFALERVDVKKIAEEKKENVEMVARKIRYRLFLKYAKKFGCNIVATAHNYDDNVETVFLNFIRGTDPEGLLGIPVKRKLSDKIFVIRPLLCVKKSEIMDYLKENGIKYAVDKTNFDTSYTRNWLRHKIIPEIEKRYSGFGKRIIDLSKKLSRVLG